MPISREIIRCRRYLRFDCTQYGINLSSIFERDTNLYAFLPEVKKYFIISVNLFILLV